MKPDALKPEALTPDSPGPSKPVGRKPRRRTGNRIPALLLIPAALGLAVLTVPLLGLLLRAPWSELPQRLISAEIGPALRLSLLCATIATGICLLLGVPLAWVLARADIPGKSIIRALVTVPMVLPPIVGGVALLLVFGRRGVIGEHLDTWLGISLPFSTAGVVLAQAFVAMPFLVLSVEGAIRASDPRYEEAAATLGASRWLIFRRVTLPSLLPAVVAGTMLCWARALGEFGATITFAGNFPGQTTTMPLAVYMAMESDPQAAIVLSLVLLLVSVAVLAAMRDRWLTGMVSR